jgi:UPF0716 protein FxsA
MLARFLWLLALAPLIELIVLVQIGRHIGALNAIGLVLLSGIIGAILARRSGLKALSRVQLDLAQGVVPAESLLDTLLIFAAGVLFIIPGVLSDVVGLLLLIPPMRAFIRNRLKSGFSARTVVLQGGPSSAAATEWVDVEPRSAHDVNPVRGELT